MGWPCSHAPSTLLGALDYTGRVAGLSPSRLAAIASTNCASVARVWVRLEDRMDEHLVVKEFLARRKLTDIIWCEHTTVERRIKNQYLLKRRLASVHSPLGRVVRIDGAGRFVFDEKVTRRHNLTSSPARAKRGSSRRKMSGFRPRSSAR